MAVQDRETARMLSPSPYGHWQRGTGRSDGKQTHATQKSQAGVQATRVDDNTDYYLEFNKLNKRQQYRTDSIYINPQHPGSMSFSATHLCRGSRRNLP